MKHNLTTHFLCRFLLLILTFGSTNYLYAQKGKDGGLTTSTNSIVNDYTSLTANASAGSTTINVASSFLSTNFAAALSAGDLLFIIQVQGASMTFPDDTTYGSIINYNNCGNYEFAEVFRVPTSNTIYLVCGLKNDYSVSGHTQIIRVPRLTTLTIGSGGSVTCPPWNGSTGGAVILEVDNGVTINSGGLIHANAKGFRAGQNATDNNTFYGVSNYWYPTNDFGAEKGEGIGGSQTDYDGMGGRFCKGAPINGGGGANAHNAGGGGGGNCGPLSWTGRGNPDLSTAGWSSAWNLEYSGFASSTSSGGGKGGYTFSGSNQNALTVGPFNSLWGGDQRRDNGGRGGRPLNYSTGKIFFGGAGGAGDQNNSYGGAGGNGGGLVYILCYNGVNGSGQVSANGQNGFSTVSAGTDGAGGGGAGGTIFLDATGIISGISANANGGNGGIQSVGGFIVEAEGPGGGGGGGYIAISGGAIARNANGGVNGTTNSFGLTEFLPNGATKGGGGLPFQLTNTFHILTSTVYVCPGSSTTLSFTTIGTVPPGTVFNWYNAAFGGTPLGSGSTYNTPILSSGQITYYVGSCPGSARFPVQVQVATVSASLTATTVCSGYPTVFSGTGASNGGPINTWSWNFGNGNSSNIQNPSYTYPTSGIYTVVLTITDPNGCTASASQSVTVTPTPSVNFSTANQSGCAPFNVSFTNTSTNALNYLWDFGDGSPTSASPTPSHLYSNTGSYTVTLTATNGTCQSSGVKTAYITVNPAPRSSFSSTGNVCLGDAISFTNLSVGNGSAITSYSWNFGDGTAASSSSNPSHTYSTAGTFNVVLTANSSACSDDTTISVVISPAPIVNFSSVNTSGCGPFTTTFSNTTTSSPIYTWNFGDGTVNSSLVTPTHTYNTSGLYTVSLIATQGSCADTLTKTSYITVYKKPISSFSTASVCLSDSVRFTNLSTSSIDPITSYTWSYGDGTTATSTGPHYYSTSGTFNVTLTSNTLHCTDDTTISVTVSPSPVVNFSSASTSGCGPFATMFTNSTTGSPNYVWSFGDGTPNSNNSTPTHTYTNAGNYTVTLIATLGTCADTLVKTNYISVYNKPLSSFTTSSVCLGDSVHFTNLSTSSIDPITSYTWNYGDGGSSSSTIPHLYLTSGIFNVVLTSSTAHCSDDTTIAVTVAQAPTANFTSPTTGACGPLTTTFINTTIGSPTFIWDFGDGTPTSNLANPTHTYSNVGNYSVTLIASIGSCSDTLMRPNYLHSHSVPLSSFATASVCLGDSVRFIDLSSSVDPLVSISWDYGDGNFSNATTSHYYSASGTYLVKLSVQTNSCSDDTTISVTVSPGPITNFSSALTSGCGSLTTAFTNITTGSPAYSWNFGDGSPLSSAVSPSHTYTSNGTFTVTLIATQGSCADTLIKTNYITVNSQPFASFTSTAVCDGDSVQFTDLSNANGGVITNYLWNYGDGITSNTSGSHLYSAAGNYTVQLTVSNTTCSDDTSLMVVVNSFPEVNFSSTATRACDSLTTTFTNLSTNGVTYSWNFGDGMTSTVESPSHLYNSPGVYSVLLSATSASGCTATKVYTNLITVKSTPSPVFSSSRTSICPGDCISFTDQTVGMNTSWNWQFGSANPVSSLSKNPTSVCYFSIGDYNVTLTVSNGSCTGSTTQLSIIHVVNCRAMPVASFISSDTNLCGGSCISFVDLSLNATSWQWQFQGAIPSTSNLESPGNICYSSPGSYTVTLIAGNNTGFDTITVSPLVNVSSLPLPPSFSQSGNVLTATPAQSYQWLYNNISISGANAQQYTATLSGLYSLSITDANGCTATSNQVQVSLVGVEELQEGLSFSIYPNPTNGNIFIRSDKSVQGKIKIAVCDLLGRELLVISNKINQSGEVWPIDLTNFACGVYVVRVLGEKQIWEKPIIKSH